MAGETGPGPRLGRGRKVLFSVVGVLLVLAFLELLGVFCYYVLIPRQSRQAIESALGVRAPERRGTTAMHFKPHPYFNYTLNPDFTYPDGRRPYNSRGFRKPEWPGRKARGTLRIVALGGSTTYGMFAARGDGVWPAMVGRALQARFSFPIEVYNLGVPGYTTSELLGVLSMLVPELEPDIVLIHCGANDAFAQVYPDEGGPDNTRFRFSWNFRPWPGPVRSVLRASRLLRAVAILLFSRRAYLPGDVFGLFQYPRPRDDLAQQYGSRATGRYFRRNLKTMAAAIRALGAIPVLITHPLNPRWDSTRKPAYRAIAAAHLRCNRISLELGTELRLPVVDLFPWMRDARLFVDAIHVNDAGMKLEAGILARHLEALIAAEWKAIPVPDRG